MHNDQDTATLPPSPWLRKWPGFQRSPSGLEWVLWRRLPFIFLVGASVPCAIVVVAWFLSSGDVQAATHRQLMQWIYMMVGMLILHLTLVLTLAIGCVIVMVMKGPAYVADPYFLDGSKQPLQHHHTSDQIPKNL
jgi:hypothetical protein